MAYPMIPRLAARPPAPSPGPERPPAAHAMIRDGEQFEDKLFGSSGEMLASPAPESAPVPPKALEIEPPPWAGAGRLDLAPPPAPPAERIHPVDAMRGEDEEWPEPDLGPAPTLPPLQRPELPPPDWKSEQAERDPDPPVPPAPPPFIPDKPDWA